MVSDPAEEDQEPYAHEDLVQLNPILRAHTIEARRKARVAMVLLRQPMPSQTSVDCCLEGAQGGPSMYQLWKSTEPTTINQMRSYLTIC